MYSNGNEINVQRFDQYWNERYIKPDIIFFYSFKVISYFIMDDCRNLKTDEVKCIKVYILRKTISQGVYLNHTQKNEFLAQRFLNKGIFFTGIAKT